MDVFKYVFMYVCIYVCMYVVVVGRLGRWYMVCVGSFGVRD